MKKGIPENAICVYKGKLFSIWQWEQEMFDGKIKTFEKVERPDTIDIIASTNEGKILILEEKQPGRDIFYGLIGGTCENNELPIETAKRELLEETGMISNDWEKFGSFKISSKFAYESHIFIAKNCKKITNQNLDEGGEIINIKEMEWKEFLDFIASDDFKVKEFALEALKMIYNGKEEELKNIILGK
ncbi:NUDIX hydrolase [Candidatus Gracilibacteria bacterium]|nr:MAG: NUDIX hydrolase [Candidatus Gracilibacteria bacterium]